MTMSTLKKLQKDKNETTDSGIDAITKEANFISKLINIITNIYKKKVFLTYGSCIIGAFLLFSMISNSMQTVTTPFTTILIEKDVLEKYNKSIEDLNNDFNNKIQLAQKGYDDVKIMYDNSEYGTQGSNIKDILSILSVIYRQELKYTPHEVDRLRQLYNSMNYITVKIEKHTEIKETTVSYIEITTDANGKEIKTTKTKKAPLKTEKRRAVITVTNLGLEDVIDSVGLTEDEKDWARELSKSDLSALFPDMNFPSDNISPEEIMQKIKKAKLGNMTRKDLIEIAKSLNGKIKYFWGGKSGAGYNSQWNKPTLVTAPGCSQSGTMQPFGLDCSGYVDWVYKTAGFGNILNGGTTQQWQSSYPIQAKDLKVGDLVFKQRPSDAGVNHVGIYIGISTAGERLYIHCAFRTGVVINNYKGFKYWRRAYIKFKGE
jgi:cell wall-associated NlpC family hydrolase